MHQCQYKAENYVRVLTDLQSNWVQTSCPSVRTYRFLLYKKNKYHSMSDLAATEGTQSRMGLTPNDD